jgi:hypothetical protein
MNDDLITSSISAPIGTMMYDNNTITIAASGNSYGAIAIGMMSDEIMDKYEFNKITVEHKVAGHELLKLKEIAPTYADEIKENLSKNASRDIIKKMSFTKKHDKDSDVHHFIGRVWVFTEEELKKLIEEVKNA